MYTEFYGLKQRPCQLMPDPALYFDSSACQRARAHLDYGRLQGEGCILLTGQAGMGKTSFLDHYLASLDQTCRLIRISGLLLPSGDFLRQIAAAFGININQRGKTELLLALEASLLETLTQGQSTLLVIDNAHTLSAADRDELAYLCNMQLGNRPLLQLLLSGEPALRQSLLGQAEQALTQLIVTAVDLNPLDDLETQAYVSHRLQFCGATQPPVFSSTAWSALHQASMGIPRRINQLLDRILLAGFLANDHHIDTPVVHRAAAELQDELKSPALSNPLPDAKRLEARLTLLEKQMAELMALCGQQGKTP